MKFPKIGLLDAVLFNDGRKVGLGVWILILATFLLFKAMLDSDKWMLCVGLATGLVGGGTLADTYLGKRPKKDEPPAPPPAA